MYAVLGRSFGSDGDNLVKTSEHMGIENLGSVSAVKSLSEGVLVRLTRLDAFGHAETISGTVIQADSHPERRNVTINQTIKHADQACRGNGGSDLDCPLTVGFIDDIQGSKPSAAV